MKLSLQFGIVACAGISTLAEPPPVPWPKPYLIIEAWKDRQWVSDLYVYDLTGRGSSFLNPREQNIRVVGQRRRETQLCEDVAALLFTPGDKDLLACQRLLL